MRIRITGSTSFRVQRTRRSNRVQRTRSGPRVVHVPVLEFNVHALVQGLAHVACLKSPLLHEPYISSRGGNFDYSAVEK